MIRRAIFAVALLALCGAPAARAVTLGAVTLPSGEVGAAYPATALPVSGASGATLFSLALGALPAGLTLEASGGVIAGTPTLAGTAQFRVRIDDESGASDTRDYTLTVAPAALALATTSLPAGVRGASYTRTLLADGGTPPYAFAVTAGALPAGLALASDGVISGSASAAGAFAVTLAVQDAAAGSASRAFTLTIVEPLLQITNDSLPDALVGTAYAATVAATGGLPPYAFAVSAGTLPAGTSLDPATGALTGTPTAAAVHSFTITATDAASPAQQAALAATVRVAAAGPVLAPRTLDAATVGVSYSRTFTALGGAGPLVWAVAAGALPTGLTLDGATGALSGTPVLAGATGATVRVTDAASASDERAYTITVLARRANVELTLVNSVGTALDPNGATFTFSSSGAVTPFAVAGGSASFDLDTANAGETCTVRVPGSLEATTAALGYNPGPTRRTVTLAPNLELTVTDELGGALDAAAATFTFSLSGAVTPEFTDGAVASFAFAGASGQTALVAQSGFVSTATAALFPTATTAAAATVALPYSLQVLGATDAAGAAVDLANAYFAGAPFTVHQVARAGGRAYVAAGAAAGLLSISVPGFAVQTVTLTPDAVAQQTVDFDEDPVLDYGAAVDGPPLPPANVAATPLELLLRDELGRDLVGVTGTYTFSASGVKTPAGSDGPIVKFSFADLGNSGETCTVSVPGYARVTTGPLNYAAAAGAQAVALLPFAVKVTAVADEAGASVPIDRVTFNASGFTIARQTVAGATAYLAATSGSGLLLALADGYTVAGAALSVSDAVPTEVRFEANAAPGVVVGPPLLYSVRLDLADAAGGALAAADGSFTFSLSGPQQPAARRGTTLLFAVSGHAGETVRVSVPGYLDTTSGALDYATQQAARALVLPTTVRIKAVQDQRGAALNVTPDEISTVGFAVRSRFALDGEMHLAATALPGQVTVTRSGFFADVVTLTPAAAAASVVAFDEGAIDPEVTHDAAGLRYALTLTLRDDRSLPLPVGSAALTFTFSGSGALAPTVYERGGDVGQSFDAAYFAAAGLGGQSLAVTASGFVTAAAGPFAAAAAPIDQALTLGYAVVLLGATLDDGVPLADLRVLAVSYQRLSLAADVASADGTTRYLALSPPTGGATDGTLGVTLVQGTDTRSALVTLVPSAQAAATVDFDLGNPGAFAATADGDALRSGGLDAFAVQLTLQDELGAVLLPPAGTVYQFSNSGVVAPTVALGNKVSFALDSLNAPETCTVRAPGFTELTTPLLNHAIANVMATVALRYRVSLALLSELGTPLDPPPAGGAFTFEGQTLAPARADGHVLQFAWTGTGSTRPQAAIPGFVTSLADAALTPAATTPAAGTVRLPATLRIVAAAGSSGALGELPAADPRAQAEGEDGLAVVFQESAGAEHFVAATGAGTLRFSVPVTIAAPGDAALFARVAATPSAAAQQTVSFDPAVAADRAGPALEPVQVELFDDDADGNLDRAALEFGRPFVYATADLGAFRLAGTAPTDRRPVDQRPARLDLLFANPQITGTQARELLFTGATLRLDYGAMTVAHAAWGDADVTERDRAAPAVIALAAADTTGTGHPDRLLLTLSEPPAPASFERADWQFVDQRGLDLLAGVTDADFVVTGADVRVTLRDRSGVPGRVRFRYRNRGRPEVALADLQTPPNLAGPLGDLANSPPVADAGPDWLLVPGASFRLTSRRSFDPDGPADLALVRWTEDPANPRTGLLAGLDPAAAELTLAAPVVGRYRFTLTVTDAAGLSAADELRVLVLADDFLPPAVDPGFVQTAELTDAGPATVALGGRLTGDSDRPELPVRIDWRLLEGPAGAAVVLDDPAQVALDLPGWYRFEAVATDDGDDTLTGLTATTEVLVLDRRLPAAPGAAQAGAGRRRELPVAHLVWQAARPADEPWPLRGRRVTLDGAGSLSPDGAPLRFRWVQESGPQQLLAGDEDTAMLTVTPGTAGRYAFRLYAGDGVAEGRPARAEFLIVERTAASGGTPLAFTAGAVRAHAGPPGTFFPLEAAVQTLAADQSHLRFEWHQLAGPPAPLAAPLDRRASFGAPRPGTYRFACTLWLDERLPWTETVDLSVRFTEGPDDAAPPVLRLTAEAGRVSAFEGQGAAARASGPALTGIPIALDAGASTDFGRASIEHLRFHWEQIEGPRAAPVAVGPARWTFTPLLPGRYRFRLYADNGALWSAPLAWELDAQRPPPVTPVPSPHVKTAGCFNAAGAPGGAGAFWALIAAAALLVRRRARAKRDGVRGAAPEFPPVPGSRPTGAREP